MAVVVVVVAVGVAEGWWVGECGWRERRKRRRWACGWKLGDEEGDVLDDDAAAGVEEEENEGEDEASVAVGREAIEAKEPREGRIGALVLLACEVGAAEELEEASWVSEALLAAGAEAAEGLEGSVSGEEGRESVSDSSELVEGDLVIDEADEEEVDIEDDEEEPSTSCPWSTRVKSGALLGRWSYSVRSDTMLLMADEIATDTSPLDAAVVASDRMRGAEGRAACAGGGSSSSSSRPNLSERLAKRGSRSKSMLSLLRSSMLPRCEVGLRADRNLGVMCGDMDGVVGTERDEMTGEACMKAGDEGVEMLDARGESPKKDGDDDVMEGEAVVDEEDDVDEYWR